jgi:hypothetical protein
MIPFSPEIVHSWIDAVRRKGLVVAFPEHNPDIFQSQTRINNLKQQGVKRGTVWCERCLTSEIKKRAVYKFNEGNSVLSFFCCECRAELIGGADEQTRKRWHSL